MSNSELKELLLSPLLQIGVINRYSGLYLTRPESVSDHICQVGILAFVIASKCILFDDKIDLGKVTLNALVHDFDEALTSDIPRNIKYFFPELRDSLHKVAHEAVMKLEEQLDFPQTQLFKLWADSKAVGLEGLIVAIADSLQVVKKALEEVELLGNKYMLRITLEIKPNLEKLLETIDEVFTLDPPAFKSSLYLIKLVNEAIDCINEIHNRHAKDIQQLGIQKLKFVGSQA
jgi:5'-deoxynucleotidase YfbR-like HD superfamily hydrolase